MVVDAVELEGGGVDAMVNGTIVDTVFDEDCALEDHSVRYVLRQRGVVDVDDRVDSNATCCRVVTNSLVVLPTLEISVEIH